MATGREKTLPKGKYIDGVSFYISYSGRFGASELHKDYFFIAQGSSGPQSLRGLVPTLIKHTIQYSSNPEDLH